ncbi:MAG: HlyD family type I secretion periplasmic adaptor subunit [Alcaligenaceae bacterium]|nr:MAG: HlyD family type I secretion periplasmic adaptor subunit [Alcaligenaceae bacterium]
MSDIVQVASVKETKVRHPFVELLARYKAIFKVAWAHRAELAGPKRLADEQAFLPAALSLQDSPVHPAPRRIAYLLMALFVIALTWAIVGKIDIVAVGTGRIIVSDRTKVVQPLENSVIRRIHVREGDHVVAGQVLLELDPTSASADKASLAETQRVTISERLRTRVLLSALSGGSVAPDAEISLKKDEIPDSWSPALVANAQVHLTAEWSDIKARLAKLNAEHQRRLAEIATVQSMIGKLEATTPIARKREQDYKALADQGFMSSHANQDRTRERIELERDLATQQARLQEALAASREGEQTRRAYIAEVRRALSERNIQADLKQEQTFQELAKATHRERLTTLTAPVTGTVQQLAVHTEGGVVTEAQPLMVVVPESAGVIAEVTLENKDIGFVSVGQEVAIKLETFPFTRYGTVKAKVEKVTQDAVNDEKRGAIFPALVSFEQTHIQIDGKPVRLNPGMNVTAEIKTGKRRVIEYLISPIQKAGKESLHER